MAESEKRELLMTLKIWGLVQGIGFRPFIARIAAKYCISGYVRNLNGSVMIEATGQKADLDAFYNDIIEKKPLAAQYLDIEKKFSDMEDSTEISDLSRSLGGQLHKDSFKILPSETKDTGPVFPPPDFSICPECEKELFDQSDRRFLHPFISCAECGPRYTIVRNTPYDRIATTMDEFKMCKSCGSEYTDKNCRRMHAQTVACHDCGPELSYICREGNEQKTRKRSKGLHDIAEPCDSQKAYTTEGEETALDCAIRDIKAGKIVAIKGIGGYHFACTPFDDIVVRRLRDLKGRENKPFAVMFPGMSVLEQYCEVSFVERENLVSSIKPIVLLKPKEGQEFQLYQNIHITNSSGDLYKISPEVSRSSRFLGSFLPYTPLHHLILRETGPLVMTSANFSDSPIIKDDEEMLRFFEEQTELAGILANDRLILRRIDDSVVQCIGSFTQIIRRARGYVPVPVETKANDLSKVNNLSKVGEILSLGGQQKNTFCLSTGNLYFLSIDNGDLDSANTFDNYKKSISEMKTLLNINPELICTDLHPEYQTTRLAQTMESAQTMELPVKYIQHHYAHIASVLAEQSLTRTVIGIAFDGTGYGTDGTMWGGEFLIADRNGFTRAGHLETLQLLGGDASVRDTQKIAACYLHAAGLDDEILDTRKDIICRAIDSKINTIESSSMGRLFDAVCSILDISQKATYEGECAIMLENEAAKASVAGIDDRYSYTDDLYEININQTEDGMIAEILPFIRQIVKDRKNNMPIPQIAYKFHATIAQMVLEMCSAIKQQTGINEVALSGGVFQNRILLGLSMDKLRTAGFKVYVNGLVPPNDGGISLGQAYSY